MCNKTLKTTSATQYIDLVLVKPPVQYTNMTDVGKKTRGKYETLLSLEEWHQIIENKLKTTDYKILNTDISPLSKNQLGFGGDHLKLQVSILLPEGNTNKKSQQVLQFFAKTVPSDNKVAEDYVSGTRSFEKEFRFYSCLVPDMKKHRLQEGQVSSWVCEFYFARPDIIVLENLTTEGYKHYTPRCTMDYNHCIVVLQTLACFHATSVVLEQEQPRTPSGKVQKLIDVYPDIFYETVWVTTKGHPGNSLLVSTIKAGLNLLEHLPMFHENSDAVKTVQEKLPDVIMEMCEFVKPSEKYRNILNHGDLWASNIFFRYGEDDKPTEACLLDFQLYHYSPPAFDFMCFLYLATSRQLREANLDTFMSVYHDTLACELRKHNLDTDELHLSWEEFKDSCDYYRRAGQVSAVAYLQNVVMKGEYLKKVYSNPEDTKMFLAIDKTKYVVENFQNDPIYRERNTEAMQELIECCILNEKRY